MILRNSTGCFYFLFEMKKNKTYQNEFKQMFEKGKDIKDLALIIDRVNQIKFDEFISRGIAIDTFEIDSSKSINLIKNKLLNRVLI